MLDQIGDGNGIRPAGSFKRHSPKLGPNSCLAKRKRPGFEETGRELGSSTGGARSPKAIGIGLASVLVSLVREAGGVALRRLRRLNAAAENSSRRDSFCRKPDCLADATQAKRTIDTPPAVRGSNFLPGRPPITTAIRRWAQSHRYQAMLRQLRALPSADLRALGISPSQIEHLAIEASRS